MNDDELRRVLHDAVDDVEPAYRLDEIRSRTARAGATAGGVPTKEVSMNESGRTWMVGVGGAVLATAAVIVAVVALGVGRGGDDTPTAGDPTSSAPTAAASPSEVAPSEAAPSEGADTPPDGGGTEVVVPVYYTVETPVGPRLVREFRRTGAAGESLEARVTAAVDTAVGRAPNDPDYATLWPEDTSVTVTAPSGGDDWVVDLDSADTDLQAAPSGVDAETAEAMRQQLVYTTQAVLQERAPITLRAGGGDNVLGGPGSGLRATAENDVLAPMNVTAPYERQRVGGDTLRATGRSNGFEATVIWEIRAGGADGEVVDDGFTTAEGWMDRLYPWTVDIDVSDLDPGDYTFVARNDDPTGGTEGAGDSADTKTFVVE